MKSWTTQVSKALKQKMTMTKTETETIPEGEDFFFWLGKDGVVEELLNEDHLNEKTTQHRQSYQDWLDVRTQIEG